MRKFYLETVKEMVKKIDCENGFEKNQILHAVAGLFENEEAFKNIVSASDIGEDLYYLILTKIRLNDYEKSCLA